MTVYNARIFQIIRHLEKVGRMFAATKSDEVELFFENKIITLKTGVVGCLLRADQEAVVYETNGQQPQIIAVGCLGCRFMSIPHKEGGCQIFFRENSMTNKMFSK
ncbi:MAG: hypothetical protein WC744_02310 [Patescibacteria group bacterium]|jgi:hypothetical protein